LRDLQKVKGVCSKVIGTYLYCTKVCGSRSVLIASVNSNVESDNTMEQPFDRAGVHKFAGARFGKWENLRHAESERIPIR
jgi:hypothetical protein